MWIELLIVTSWGKEVPSSKLGENRGENKQEPELNLHM